MNAAAQRAGLLGTREHMDLHGEDPTFADVKEMQKPNPVRDFAEGEIVPSIVHTGADLTSLVVEEHIAHAIETIAEPAGIALAAKESVETLVRAWENGDRQKEALLQDAMHLAIVETMKGMPQSYLTHCVQQRREAAGGPAQLLMQDQLRREPALRTILQIRCDEGMKAAEQAFVQGEGTRRFFELNKDLYARYQADAAFRAGFDAVVFAHAEGDASFQKVLRDLHARDARYSATNVIWRG
jgi:hypothetical protein